MDFITEIMELLKNDTKENSKDLDIFTNQSINKIDHALNKFSYNVIIATYHEIYSYYKKIVEKKKNYKNLKNNFGK